MIDPTMKRRFRARRRCECGNPDSIIPTEGSADGLWYTYVCEKCGDSRLVMKPGPARRIAKGIDRAIRELEP